MADTTWDIDGITANGLVGSQPALTEGETASYTVRFAPDSGIATDHQTRAGNLKDYQRFAGASVVWKTIQGEVRFREQHQQTPDHVVPIQAGSGTQSTQDIWGLIQGVSIQEDNTPQERIVISLDVVYLADYSEYATEADLRAVLEK